MIEEMVAAVFASICLETQVVRFIVSIQKASIHDGIASLSLSNKHGVSYYYRYFATSGCFHQVAALLHKSTLY